MMKRQTGFLKDEVHVMTNKKKRFMKAVHVMMNQKKRLMEEGMVHIAILNQARRPPIKEEDHFMKMSQGRRLLRGY